MYLRNSWYVVAWAHALGEQPLAITALDQALVIFRDGDGAPAVLEDRCAHRHLPLSMGCTARGGIECGYHGMIYDRDGKCHPYPEPAGDTRQGARAQLSGGRTAWLDLGLDGRA